MRTRLASAGLLLLGVALGLLWPVQASYIPTPFKSIQPISITVAGAASNTQTVTSVTPANSILLDAGRTSSDASGFVNGGGLAWLTLTNATTVTATRGVNNADTAVIKGVLLEFLPGMLKSSTQCGTIAYAGGSSTATITSVDTTKAILVSTGFGNNYNTPSSAGDSNVFPVLTLTNATTVTSSNIGGSFTVTHGYCVAEGR